MAQQIINTGAVANDGTGESLRDAFNAVNDNFSNIWAQGPVDSQVVITNNTVTTNQTNLDLVLAANGIGNVTVNSTLTPGIDSVYDLGASDAQFDTVWARYYQAGSGTFSGDVTVDGNLVVAGNIIQVGNIVTDSLTIQLGNTVTNAAGANGAGITVGANDNIATMLYSSTSNTWTMNIGANITGNVTAPYFIGNGALLTGIATSSYANANAVAYGQAGWAGNIIPSGNAVYSLGNATNQWNDLYVSNTTIYMNNVPISLTAGNVLTVNGNAVLQNDSNTSIATTGNISAANIAVTSGSLSWPNASIVQTSASDFSITGDGQVTVRSLDGTYQWTFDNAGNLTLPLNGNLNFNGGNIVQSNNDDLLITAVDNDGVTSSSLEMSPNNTLTRLEQWSSQDSNSWTTADWATGVYTIEGGLGAVQFTGAATIVDFVNSLQETGHIFFSVNGGPQLVWDGTSSGATNITFYTPTLPATDPTTVTSFEYFYSYKSGFEIDYDSSEVNIYANEADINLQTTGQRDIGLNSSGVVTITANSASTWTFDTAGNLTVPGVIQGSADSDYALKLGAFPEEVNAGRYLQVRSGDVADHIHFDTSNNSAWNFYVGSDNQYVLLGNTGNISIGSYDSGNNTTYQWTFDNTGNLAIPGTIVSESTVIIDNRASGNGADIQLYSADDILIQARDRSAGSGSEGGDINIYAGDSAEDGDSSGGDVTIEAGNGGAANVDFGGSGGFVTVQAGAGGDASTQVGGASASGGGSLTLNAGSAGSNMGNIDRGSGGGDVTISAGDSTGNNSNGGEVSINTGAGGANALSGGLYINIPESGQGTGGAWVFDGTGTTFNVPGNSSIYGANFGNFTVGCAGNTIVTSSDYGANVQNWVFGYTGTLTAPGSVEIGTGNTGVQLRSNQTGLGFYATVAGITNGSSTVVVTLNDVEFTEGDQGTVTITGVLGETEANGFWGWRAVEVDQIQLYTDGTFSTPVDGTTWGAYDSGGLAVSSGYNELDIQGGSVAIISGAGKYWSFKPDGTTLYPTLTVTRGDRTGTLTGQALVFGDATQEALISTPNGTSDINSSQRFVINPGAGYANTTGEGGDIYLYAGRGGSAGGSGGDIKIRGGLGPVNGDGGYIDIIGGEASADGVGGYIDIQGGQSGNSNGGDINITGGQGRTGGDANITGGVSTAGPGGPVNITGGTSSNGLAEYGNVNITSGASTWTFDNTGTLIVPGEGLIRSINDTIELQSYDTANTTAYKLRVGANGGVYLEIGTAEPWLTFTNDSGDAEIGAAPGAAGTGNAGYDLFLFGGSADTSVYGTGAGGNIQLRAGYGAGNDGGGGGPGGWVNIIAGDSTDPAGVPGNVTINSGINTWTFDYNGTLNLPEGTSYIGSAANSLTLHANDSEAIYISAISGGISAETNGNITLISNVDGVTNYAWTFDNTGNLTLPANTFSVNYANGDPVSLGGASSYGNANVADFLGSLGSNAIVTTGNITGGNLIATANVLGNGYARLTGTFDESQASTAGLYLGYAGGTPRIMFGTGNTQQTFEIDNDAGTLRFYQPGSTKASLTSSGIFSAAGNISGANLLASANLSVVGSIIATNFTGYGNVTFNQTLSTSGGQDMSLIPGSGLVRSYGNLRPYFANTYDLGGSTTRWNNIYANVNNSITQTVTGNITGGNILTAGLITATGNITTAGNFVGNGAALTNVTVSVAGNIVGTQSNVTLVAGSYSYTFDNTGILTLPAGGGNEGAEINFTKAANSTLSGNSVAIDQYVDRIRFFEGGGNTRGAYIDLTQAADGVGTLLNNRVSGLVNAGTFVTMDLLKATVTTSGNRGLSLAATTGSFNINISGTYGGVGGASGSAGTGTINTTPSSSQFGWNFTSQAEGSTYIITDTTNNRAYRVTLQIGGSFNNNLISIERLI